MEHETKNNESLRSKLSEESLVVTRQQRMAFMNQIKPVLEPTNWPSAFGLALERFKEQAWQKEIPHSPQGLRYLKTKFGKLFPQIKLSEGQGLTYGDSYRLSWRIKDMYAEELRRYYDQFPDDDRPFFKPPALEEADWKEEVSSQEILLQWLEKSPDIDINRIASPEFRRIVALFQSFSKREREEMISFIKNLNSKTDSIVQNWEAARSFLLAETQSSTDSITPEQLSLGDRVLAETLAGALFAREEGLGKEVECFLSFNGENKWSLILKSPKLTTTLTMEGENKYLLSLANSEGNEIKISISGNLSQVRSIFQTYKLLSGQPSSQEALAQLFKAEADGFPLAAIY